MADGLNLVRIPTLKTVADFRQHVTSLSIDLPCEDDMVSGPASPLLQPIEHVTINRKKIGARYAIQPMEGWDGTTTGGITEEVVRRWQRFLSPRPPICARRSATARYARRGGSR